MDHAHHLHHLTNLGAFAYFLLGLTGSWHCVGMCGPLSVLLLTQNKSSHLSILSLYHAGRVVVYTLLGLLLASLGLSFHGILPQSVLLTLLIIPLLFYAFGISLPLPNTLQKLSLNLHAKIKNLHPYKRAILIGVFTPLLPCGLLYAALAGVLMAPSPWQGGLWMTSFALGTIPLLLLTQMGFRFVAQKPQFKYFFRLLAFLAALSLALFQLLH